MIEIVYDKNSAKQTMNLDNSIKLPKNIRQIGNTSTKRKIYIEDYVMTFLKRIAKPGNTCSRGAILLGEYQKDGEENILFINGAVEAQNLEFDVEQISFDDQTWSGIYSDVNKYFDGLEVVGWFLSRMGFSVGINERISKLHLQNFPGEDKVLFMMDSLENEDVFYVVEKGMLIKSPGYYIYYVRNEQMQNYLVSRNNCSIEDKNCETIKKDQALVKNFEEMRGASASSEKKKNSNYFVYAVSSFVMIFALSVGIALSGSYDKMKDIESSVKKMEMETESPDLEVFAEGNNEDSNKNQSTDEEVGKEKTEDAEAKTENTQVDENSTEVDYGEEKANSETSEESTEKNNKTGEDVESNQLTYYVIQDGDTLMSISIKMYDSPNYVEEIMNANGINEGDTIYTGQKIIIPNIN